VLTECDLEESWFAAVLGVSPETAAFFSVLEGAVAPGALAELRELLVEGDQAEVEHVHPIPEMLESEPCPDLLERCDCRVPLGVASLACSCLGRLVERGGVADRGAGSAGQLPDGRPGQQRAQAEAPPLPYQPDRCPPAVNRAPAGVLRAMVIRFLASVRCLLTARSSAGSSGSCALVRWSIRDLTRDRDFFVAHSAALTGHGATHGAHRAGSSAAHRAMS